MKHLVFGLAFAAVSLAQHPQVSDCFKVHELLRADEEHYWATWTNTCPYTIDSVYVMVKFADRSAREVADGVWSLHFITPGAHRTMRFSAPGKLADFASVRQRKITADIYEAFGRPAPPSQASMSTIEATAVYAFKQAVAKDGDSMPRVKPASTIINDSGEAVYREQRAREILAAATFVQAAPATRPALAVGDPGEGSFRTDFPDPWRALLTPQESAVSQGPRAAFVRFVSEEKPIFQ